MKKVLIILMKSLLIIALALSSYPSAGAERNWPKNITMAAGTGSAFFSVFAGLAKMMKEHLGVIGTPIGTTGYESFYLMRKGEVQMAAMGVMTDSDGFRGLGKFKEGGKVPARAFLGSFTLDWNLITLEGKGIKSFTDLKGKTVYAWVRGVTTHEEIFKGCLYAYGLKEADLKAVVPYDKGTEMFNALISGGTDAVFAGASFPSSPVVELAMTHPMRLIGLDRAHFEKLKKQLSFDLYPVIIPAGTYKGNSEDIMVPGYGTRLFCHKDLPDDFIYKVVKMVFESFGEWGSYHPICKKFSPNDVLKYETVAYHPGAIRYYKEIGIWTSELDKRQAKLLTDIGETR